MKESGLHDLVIQDWPNAVRTIIYRNGVEPASERVNSSVEPTVDRMNGLVNGSVNGLVNDPVKGRVKSPVKWNVIWTKGSFAGKLDFEPISPAVLKVFECIENQPGCRQNNLAQQTGISERRVKRYIAELKKKNLVEFRGAPKNGGYWVTDRGRR